MFHYTFGVLLSTLQELAFRAGYHPALSIQPCWGEKRPARSVSGNLERKLTRRQRGQSPVLHLQGMYVVSGRTLSRNKERDFSAPKSHLQPHPRRIIIDRNVPCIRYNYVAPRCKPALFDLALFRKRAQGVNRDKRDAEAQGRTKPLHRRSQEERP